MRRLIALLSLLAFSVFPAPAALWPTRAYQVSLDSTNATSLLSGATSLEQALQWVGAHFVLSSNVTAEISAAVAAGTTNRPTYADVASSNFASKAYVASEIASNAAIMPVPVIAAYGGSTSAVYGAANAWGERNAYVALASYPLYWSSNYVSFDAASGRITVLASGKYVITASLRVLTSAAGWAGGGLFTNGTPYLWTDLGSPVAGAVDHIVNFRIPITLVSNQNVSVGFAGIGSPATNTSGIILLERWSQ